MRGLIPWVAGLLCLVGAGSLHASDNEATTPEPLADLIAAAGDSSSWPGAPVVVVFDSTEIDVEASGLGHVRRHELIKILNEEGARDRASLRFDYDPASNFIRLESIRIHRADRSIIEIDPETAVDLAAPAHMIYWGARMKILSVPRLKIGDAIEIRTYKKGFQIAYLHQDGPDGDDERYIPPMRGHFYDVVMFQDTVPLKEKSYIARVPRDKPIQYAVYNGELAGSLRFAESALVYSWYAQDVPALEAEPRTPDQTDIVPKVVLATVEDWPAKSRWFFDVNEPVFEANDAIRAKVAEVTRGLTSDDEKMAALLHWVAQEIRYSGLSMGKGEGYTLHPSIMTFEDRCGVCKDIAGMLVTMLRVAGYTTYPVMTMAGSRVEVVPADQFNHCVVAVENPDGSYRMLDPTWAPFSNAIWSRWEGEQHYVIGSPEGEDLMAIRSFTPEENRMRIESRSEITTEGTLLGELTLSGVGISDGRIRSSFAYAPAGDQGGAVAALLADLGNQIEVIDYVTTDPRDFSIDAEIQIRYRVPHYAAVGESLVAFVPPAVRIAASSGRITRLLAFQGSGERENVALLWAPQEVTVTEAIELPRGMRADGAIDTVRVDNDTAAFRARYQPSGRKVELELNATLKKRTVPAEEWGDGVTAADSLRAFGMRPRWGRRG